MAREQVLLGNRKPKHLRSQNVPVKNVQGLVICYVALCLLGRNRPVGTAGE